MPRRPKWIAYSCLLQRPRQVDETRSSRLKILRWISGGRATSIGPVALVRFVNISRRRESNVRRVFSLPVAAESTTASLEVYNCVVPFMIGVGFSTEKSRWLYSSGCACSWVAIIHAKSSTMEGDGFLEADCPR